MVALIRLLPPLPVADGLLPVKLVSACNSVVDSARRGGRRDASTESTDELALWYAVAFDVGIDQLGDAVDESSRALTRPPARHIHMLPHLKETGAFNFAMSVCVCAEGESDWQPHASLVAPVVVRSLSSARARSCARRVLSWGCLDALHVVTPQLVGESSLLAPVTAPTTDDLDMFLPEEEELGCGVVKCANFVEVYFSEAQVRVAEANERSPYFRQARAQLPNKRTPMELQAPPGVTAAHVRFVLQFIAFGYAAPVCPADAGAILALARSWAVAKLEVECARVMLLQYCRLHPTEVEARSVERLLEDLNPGGVRCTRGRDSSPPSPFPPRSPCVRVVLLRGLSSLGLLVGGSDEELAVATLALVNLDLATDESTWLTRGGTFTAGLTRAFERLVSNKPPTQSPSKRPRHM